MAHSVAYNTEDPGATGMKYVAVEGKGEVTLPLQTDKAERITGSIFSEQAGAVFVEQTFDGVNWDISEEVKIEANKAQGFEKKILAPLTRVRFVNGNTETKKLRFFARAFQQGR